MAMKAPTLNQIHALGIRNRRNLSANNDSLTYKKKPKTIIAEHLNEEAMERLKQSFNLAHLDSLFRGKAYTSEEELKRELGKAPLERAFQEQANEFFPCKIFKDNFAWISQDVKGHVRYFSKSKKEITRCADLMDIVSLITGLKNGDTSYYLATELGLDYSDATWKKSQKHKYLKNINYLFEGIESSPHLYNLLKDHLGVLHLINTIGLNHLHHYSDRHNSHNIFFASASYLARELQTTNTGKIAQQINLFATLGLIEKVQNDFIPKKMLDKANELRLDGEKIKHNRVNFYIVHSFKECGEGAEEKAKVLLEHGVRHSNISKSSVARLFSQDYAKVVFPEDVKCNLSKYGNRRDNIDLLLEENFGELLKTYGFVTKSMLANMKVFQLSKSQKENYIKKNWKQILVRHSCHYKKPTKPLVESYVLPSFEYIAIPEGKDIEEQLYAYFKSIKKGAKH